MTRSFTRSVYGSPMSEAAARAVMNGGRASSSRSRNLTGIAGAPVTAHVSTSRVRSFVDSDPALPAGMRYADDHALSGNRRVSSLVGGGTLADLVGGWDASGNPIDMLDEIATGRRGRSF